MKMLFATDGSEYSEEAARLIAGLSFSKGDEIAVLHVIGEIPYEDESLTKFTAVKKTIGKKILKSAMETLEPLKAKKRALLAQGYPDTVIMEEALDMGADLIVMGARGVKGMKLLVLGSSTRSVAINAKIPLLAVKPRLRDVSDGMRVLYATDGSDSAEAAGLFLSVFPFPSESELTVLNVSRGAFTDIPEKFVSEIDDRIKEAVAKEKARDFQRSATVIDKAVRTLKERFRTIKGITKTGDPTVEILSQADDVGADIIVLGNRGLRGIKGMLGSVSRNILGRSKCSVIIGKTAE